ncbi:MAG: hypothetical protein Nkreftii_000495 [Candidatus Nitrospira kreftii]|mgnify:CR=1 FL=1|uniref:Uncharacterized protein n=1 Tax=Candidatus Nitrospira kreftii TaxID=2652173 RepID=A0A7S8FBN3_9BACT|nr:MAG: hypothetical protein Nkreftii_000495 [Candidatus Nitrospira kreftii]
MATLLVFLLLILTFNAYACVLPLPTVTKADCSSDTDDQARQTCDAFLEIGPHSQLWSNHAVSLLGLECAVPIESSATFVSSFKATPAPGSADTPIHLSIPNTVLRI